jgi:predicted permease
MFNNLIISLGYIFLGLIVGYIIQQLEERKIIHLPISLEKLRKLLQKIGLLFFMPISFIGALWMVKIDNLNIIALPFLGIFALLMGGVLGFASAKLFKLNRKDTGSMFVCGSFTNIGSIGGLVCYLFLGEKGFALFPIYKLFEQVIYYAIGFPIAKSFSNDIIKKEKITSQLKKVFTDIFVIVALASITIGAFFNLSGIERPEFYKTINAIFIPGGTIILLISIGLAVKFRKVKKYIKECITISIIKFILMPLIISTIAIFLGYGLIEGSLPLKVVIILSSMPVAFSALVPASIYDLNLDLANSCWLVTTLSLIIILPLLFCIISLI